MRKFTRSDLNAAIYAHVYKFGGVKTCEILVAVTGIPEANSGSDFPEVYWSALIERLTNFGQEDALWSQMPPKALLRALRFNQMAGR